LVGRRVLCTRSSSLFYSGQLKDFGPLHRNCGGGSQLTIQRCLFGIPLLNFSGQPLQHREQRIVPFTCEEYFDIVVDVGKYDTFLPWCQKSCIVKERDPVSGIFMAELVVGFKLFRERYISSVDAERPFSISVSASDSSVFEKLVNTWRFRQGPQPRSCIVDFKIDFKFRSIFHHHAANIFLSEVSRVMVASFDRRVADYYGKGGASPLQHSADVDKNASPLRFVRHNGKQGTFEGDALHDRLFPDSMNLSEKEWSSLSSRIQQLCDEKKFTKEEAFVLRRMIETNIK